MNPAGMPEARKIVPIVVAVAAVHGLVLRMQPDQLVSPSALATSTFATRQLVPPAPPPLPAPVAPARVAARAPAPVPREAAPLPHTAAPAHEDTRPTASVTPPSDTVHAQVTPQAPSSEPIQSGKQPHPAAIPLPAKLHYEVQASAKGFSLSGNAELHWRHDGNQYEARPEISSKLLPTRVQTSVGRVSPQGLVPSRFSETTRTEQATHFEWDKGQVTFSSNKPAAALLEGTQDRLSVVLQLCAMVGGDPSLYPPGTSIVVPTAGTRESENWVFTVEGEEDLTLPGGKLRALKLQRAPRKEYDVKVELWLAPRMDYAPVRVRLTNPNGDSVDQRWASTDKG